MGLIKCSECGKEISDKAEKCPNCGAPVVKNAGTQSSTAIPVQNQSNKNSSLGVVALILSVIGCTFIFGVVLAIIDLCKKDGKKKTCSIIALGICAVWFIIGVSVNMGKDNSNNSIQEANKTVETNSSIAQTTPKEDTTKETEVESQKAEEKKTKEEETKDKYAVGDTWNNKYVLVSYDECGEYTSDNQFIQPADGNKYVYATFTFENVGKSDTTVAYWDFDCYADGFACEGTYTGDGAAFSQTLSAGRKISGSVYFEVPKDVEEIEFEYSPSFWTSEKVVFVYSE